MFVIWIISFMLMLFDYNIYCEAGGTKYTLEVKNLAVTDKGAIFETEAPPTRNYTMNYFQDPSIPVVLLTSTPAATNCVQLTDTMVLKCEVDCIKPEPTLKWKLQGKELPGGLFSTESCSDGSTKVTSLISINVAQLININNTARKYTIACELSYGACVSSENMHTNTTCVQIVNTDPPIPVVVITSTPAAVTNCVQINETMDLMLRCDVDCTKPEPTLKWNLEGKELSGGSSSTYNTGCSSGLNKITNTILSNATHLSNNANSNNDRFIVTCELSYEDCASSENIFTDTICVQIIKTYGSRARGSRKTSIDQQKDNITENEGENKQTNNKKTEKDSKDKQTNYELTENQREEHTTENARPGDKKPRELPLPSYTRPLPPIKSKA